MKRLTIFTILMALLALLIGALTVQAQGRPQGVATHIIVFRSDVNANAAAADLAAAHGLGVSNIYSHALNGMAAVVPAGRLRALSNDPRVAYVEENMEAHIEAQQVPTGIIRSYASSNANLDIDGSDDFRVDVDVAVVDTGIDFQHPDLNVMGGVDCSGGSPIKGSCSAGGDDNHYHGTHVAGTIGALDNGIGVVGMAPGARLWAVKVLNSQGSGYTSWIVAGIDWVVAQGNIEVLNMSLGGAGTSQAYLDAINNAVNNGVVVVVAAGNESADANGYSPAFVPAAITVSALSDFDGLPGGLAAATCRADEDDTFANFSNYGSAVDMIAPGVCITSTYPIEQGEYGTISGTSMASPHVAGAAALLASGANAPQNAADVQAIRDTLVNSGNFNWDNSDDPDSIKEPLLDVSSFSATLVASGGGGGDPTPTPPPSGSTVMHVSDIDGQVSYKGNRWSASAFATIVDGDGNPVAGATVNMNASGAVNGSGSCTTNSAGTCGLSTGNISGGTYETFTVTGVSLSGYTYDSGLNSDPDGDSDGTSITIYR
jgi:subtilisin family serine protease